MLIAVGDLWPLGSLIHTRSGHNQSVSFLWGWNGQKSSHCKMWPFHSVCVLFRSAFDIQWQNKGKLQDLLGAPCVYRLREYEPQSQSSPRKYQERDFTEVHKKCSEKKSGSLRIIHEKGIIIWMTVWHITSSWHKAPQMSRSVYNQAHKPYNIHS